MSSVSEVVEAAFSDVSFGLDGDHRFELVTVIDLQVNDLLRQLTEYYHNYVRTAYRMLTQSFQKVVTEEMSNEKLMFLENR